MGVYVFCPFLLVVRLLCSYFVRLGSKGDGSPILVLILWILTTRLSIYAFKWWALWETLFNSRSERSRRLRLNRRTLVLVRLTTMVMDRSLRRNWGKFCSPSLITLTLVSRQTLIAFLITLRVFLPLRRIFRCRRSWRNCWKRLIWRRQLSLVSNNSS